MKYLLMILISFHLFAEKTQNPVELTYLNQCLNFQSSRIQNISLTQDQYSSLIKSIILKGLLSRDNFPNYLANKNVHPNEVSQIFTVAQNKASIFCPLTRYVLNGLKNDYLKNKKKFTRYLPHLSPWFSYFKSSNGPEGLRPLYRKIAQQIQDRLSIFKGKIKISYTNQPIMNESMIIDQAPTIDMNAELDSLFETIE